MQRNRDALIHLVGEIEIAALFEKRPVFRTRDLAQHIGGFFVRDRFRPNRHDVAVLAHLRRLTFADVQIGGALLDEDREELIDVGHFKKSQIPSSKLQGNPNLQAPNKLALWLLLEVETWSFLGIWDLGFGISFPDMLPHHLFLFGTRVGFFAADQLAIKQVDERIVH